MTTDDSDAPAIECATYTHARRHPMVLGKIGGWSPPFQLTIVQIGVLAISLGTMLWTWQLWARAPGTVNLFLVMAIPSGLTWAVRHMRIEGRDPLRCFVGLLTYLSSPRGGTRHGRPDQVGRRRRFDASRIPVGVRSVDAELTS